VRSQGTGVTLSFASASSPHHGPGPEPTQRRRRDDPPASTKRPPRPATGSWLTHGGFYAHFKSKDDLVAQAITHMFDASYARFLGHTEGRDVAEALKNFIDAYFAPSHRLNRAGGCPIAALSDDLPNFPELARARFTDGTERFVAGLAKLIERLGVKNADALAWSAMAEMAARSRCRVPCPTLTERRKFSAIRAPWCGRGSASIDRRHAAVDGSGLPDATT
jgi:AcrR family transcriptional regulator